MRISHLRQRLRDLGCKPCHKDRLLRGWSQVCSYDRKHSPAETFFPLALRNELPAIEAELNGLARLHGEYPADVSSKPDLLPLPPGEGRGEGSNSTSDSLTLPLSQRERGFNRHFDNEKVARLLLELADGQMVESVLLPRGGLCVSTQVGCAVGCVFCMSGRNGLLRQLGSAEIVAQVVLARRRRAVSKVVFMGMGEPAHNLDNVLEAIDVLGTQGNIGHKNLVFSTVGDLRVFERLMEGLKQRRSPIPPLTPPLKGEGHIASPPPFQGEGWGGGGGGDGVSADGQSRSNGTVKPALALSLHTTDAALRAKLLPHAPHIPVEELVERAEVYARATGYPVQYQWTLIEGVNDSDAELERIAQLLSGKYAIMNFIPFNAVDGLPYRRPSAERTAAMMHTLNRQGIYSRVRDSAGQEVEGACGQLRARAAKTKQPTQIKTPISL
jgi:23S rRNA (adenine2503-C2)-methyltransferase